MEISEPFKCSVEINKKRAEECVVKFIANGNAVDLRIEMLGEEATLMHKIQMQNTRPIKVNLPRGNHTQDPEMIQIFENIFNTEYRFKKFDSHEDWNSFWQLLNEKFPEKVKVNNLYDPGIQLPVIKPVPKPNSNLPQPSSLSNMTIYDNTTISGLNNNIYPTKVHVATYSKVNIEQNPKTMPHKPHPSGFLPKPPIVSNLVSAVKKNNNINKKKK
jgi:hypothetical protein